MMDKIAHCLFEQSGTFKNEFKKPTQYWFINCEPKFNIILEPLTIVKYKTVNSCWDKVERSMINPQYANRFIREFIL